MGRVVECWVDGGNLGRNPSPRGVYWSVVIEGWKPTFHGQPVELRQKSADYHTNSDAEWLAVLTALRWCVDKQVTLPVILYSDSQFVVKEFNGVTNIRIERHIRWFYECKRLAESLPRPVELRWVSREVMVRKVGH